MKGLYRTFDFPSPDATSPQRDATTVSPQALFLMNHPFSIECARRLVRRPDVAAEKNVAGKVTRLYRLLYGRAPKSEELLLAEEYLSGGGDVAWERYGQALLMSDEFLAEGGIRTLSAREERFRPRAYHNGNAWGFDSYLTSLGFALVLLIVVLLLRMILVKSYQVQAPPVTDLTVDARAAAGRLAGALRFPTISHEGGANVEAAAFQGLHQYLQQTFPSVHATLTREVVNGYSLLYTWKGRRPELPPVLLLSHQDVVPVAGCHVFPLSVETSTPATTPPPESDAVPVIVTGVPLVSVVPVVGAVILDVGAV